MKPLDVIMLVMVSLIGIALLLVSYQALRKNRVYYQVLSRKVLEAGSVPTWLARIEGVFALLAAVFCLGVAGKVIFSLLSRGK